MSESFSLLKTDLPIALCSDHAGFKIKSVIIDYLKSNDIAYKDFGTYSIDSCDYPDFAHPCAVAIEKGECFPGIAVCSTGNGISMTLNKHQNIRAALCWDVDLARLAREHNDANILVLPGNFISPELAIKLVEIFLTTPFEGGRHQRRVNKIPL